MILEEKMKKSRIIQITIALMLTLSVLAVPIKEVFSAENSTVGIISNTVAQLLSLISPPKNFTMGIAS